MSKTIKVIDLFAGPGGLGEGFAGCKKNSPYDIVMSVEGEPNAHRTLTLRAFYRALSMKGKRELLKYFKSGDAALLGQIKNIYPQEWEKAASETLLAPTRLGNEKIWEKIGRGERIIEEDRRDTADQKKISRKIREIRGLCEAQDDRLIVIGGPPCQAYSINGRNRAKAIEGYSQDEDERYFLYLEYCRVLHEAQPDAFVMENVPGILSARLANNTLIFPTVLASLQSPSKAIGKSRGKKYRLYSFIQQPDNECKKGFPEYSVLKAFKIEAERFGLPQTRERIIVLGIREDHGKMEQFLDPGDASAPCVEDIIGSMPPIRSGISEGRKTHSVDNATRWVNEWNDSRKELVANLKDSKVSTEIRAVQKRAGASQSSLSTGDRNWVPFNSSGFSRSFEKACEVQPGFNELMAWINPLGDGFLNHSCKYHQHFDRKIYMFCAAYAKAHSENKSPSPKSKDFPGFLAPKHENWESGDYADRFRCLEASKVAKTITSHLKKDGHAYIHYDIVQNRCISPREAARIQTFPDDYFFHGEQGSQYHQVGNAVPPFLAKKLALHLLKVFRTKKLI